MNSSTLDLLQWHSIQKITWTSRFLVFYIYWLNPASQSAIIFFRPIMLCQHFSFHSYHIYILCFYWTNFFYIQITFILQHKKITFIIKSSKFWLFDKMKLRLSLPIHNVCLRWFSISKFVFSKIFSIKILMYEIIWNVKKSSL